MADIYKEQWEEEIKRFLKGLEAGDYIQLENSFAVLYTHDNEDTDPRYIVYNFGDCRLEDDHFCIQHSRALTDQEMNVVFDTCARLGIDYMQWDWDERACLCYFTN